MLPEPWRSTPKPLSGRFACSLPTRSLRIPVFSPTDRLPEVGPHRNVAAIENEGSIRRFEDRKCSAVFAHSRCASTAVFLAKYATYPNGTEERTGALLSGTSRENPVIESPNRLVEQTRLSRKKNKYLRKRRADKMIDNGNEISEKIARSRGFASCRSTRNVSEDFLRGFETELTDSIERNRARSSPCAYTYRTQKSAP